jgi:hypothetical protein
MFIKYADLDQNPGILKGVQGKADETLLVFAAENGANTADRMVTALRATQSSFVGAVFPKVIHNFVARDDGFVIVPLKVARNPMVLSMVHSDQWTSAVGALAAQTNSPYMVILDGLSMSVSKFIDNLYSGLGGSHQYMGGGAGSLSFNRYPCVFDNRGVYNDHALLIELPGSADIGVGHGWRPIHEGLVANHTEGNVIFELNWRPAGEVYRELVEPHAKNQITVENFFSISKAFPFGIQRAHGDVVVRDPIQMTDKDALVCVGHVPVNSVLSLLTGNQSNLVEAAGVVAWAARNQKRQKPQNAFVFDCVSRSIFLGSEFLKELGMISKVLDRADCLGALTLGEIASDGHGVPEFLNKTLVIGGGYES